MAKTRLSKLQKTILKADADVQGNQMTTEQLTIFEQATGTKVPLVEVPDFHGDFVAEMDYIASLSTEDRENYLEREEANG